MKKIFLAITVFVLVACSSDYKMINYDTTSLSYNKEIKLKFRTLRGYKTKSITYLESEELILVYNDSSIFFISNNHVSGSDVNKKNRHDMGIDVIFKEKYNDTLIYAGKDKQGMNWKEVFLDDIVIGYKNIEDNRKSKFDSIISSVKRH